MWSQHLTPQQGFPMKFKGFKFKHLSRFQSKLMSLHASFTDPLLVAFIYLHLSSSKRTSFFSSKIAHFLLKIEGLHMVWIDNAHLVMNTLPLLSVLWDKCARLDKCNFSIGISTCHRKEDWTDVRKRVLQISSALTVLSLSHNYSSTEVAQGKRHLPHCQFPLLSLTSQTIRTKSSSTFSIFLILRGQRRSVMKG